MLSSENPAYPISIYLDTETFRRAFYRIVDTLVEEDDSKERMIEIETSIYKVIKKEMDEDEIDFAEKNRKADGKIASAVLTSFKVYENSRNKHQVSYFNFK